jgi:RHS repeat-associated protein
MGGLGSCADSTSDNPPTSAASLGGPAPYWQTYAFDGTGAAGLGNGGLTGNRSTIVDHDPTGNTAKDVTRTSAYPAAGTANTAQSATTGGTGPNLLSAVNATGGASGTDNYTYDGSGNLTGRSVSTQGASGNANETLTWDDEGQLATDKNTTTNITSSFVHDAAGNTLMRRDYTSGTQSGTVTLYLGSTELHVSTSNGAVTGTRSYTYPSAPQIVADNLGGLTYEIGNQQGTAGTTVNAANGTVTARRYFTPFGGSRGATPSSWPDDHTFLNKPTDASTGLTTIGARSYDAQTGRFVSADPIFETGDENQMGGYAYAGDDPVSASDPTGQSSGPSPARLCEMNDGVWENGSCNFGPTPAPAPLKPGDPGFIGPVVQTSSSGSPNLFAPGDCGGNVGAQEVTCSSASGGLLGAGAIDTGFSTGNKYYHLLMETEKMKQAGLNSSAEAYKAAAVKMSVLKNNSSYDIFKSMNDSPWIGKGGKLGKAFSNSFLGANAAVSGWSEWDTARDAHHGVIDSGAKTVAAATLDTAASGITVLQAAGAGAAIGGMIDPLGGEIPGALIGSVVGAVASIPVTNMVNNVINWFD